MAPFYEYLQGTANSGAVPPQLLRRCGCRADFPTGKGITIGIVTAFGNPDAKKDLSFFSRAFSLPAPRLYPEAVEETCVCSAQTRRLWQIESALDLEWAHAFAPDAVLRWFAPGSDAIDALMETAARAAASCEIVSLSFGVPEFPGQNRYENILAKLPALFVCALGDAGIGYPGTSAHVLSVGGERTGGGRWENKIGREAHGFKSRYTPPNGGRQVPDLSFFSDEVRIYCEKVGGWTTASGTSVGAPCVAGLCARIAQNDHEVLAGRDEALFHLRTAFDFCGAG